jgi:hypothetical protein
MKGQRIRRQLGALGGKVKDGLHGGRDRQVLSYSR